MSWLSLPAPTCDLIRARRRTPGDEMTGTDVEPQPDVASTCSKREFAIVRGRIIGVTTIRQSACVVNDLVISVNILLLIKEVHDYST